MAQTQIKSLTDENKKLHTPESVVNKLHLELTEALGKNVLALEKIKYLEGEDKSPLDTIVEKLEYKLASIESHNVALDKSKYWKKKIDLSSSFQKIKSMV